MEQITAPVRLFTYQNPRDNSIELKSLSIHFNNTDFYLTGETGDSIYIFKESIALYVLAINKRIGRITLNTYMAPEADPITTVALHTPEEVQESVGLNWKHKDPLKILFKLMDQLM